MSIIIPDGVSPRTREALSALRRIQVRPRHFAGPASPPEPAYARRFEIFADQAKAEIVGGLGGLLVAPQLPVGFSSPNLLHTEGLCLVEEPTDMPELPSDLLGIVPRRADSVKIVPIFGNAMIHNTKRLDELDPLQRMADNPMLALDRLYTRAFALMDGERSLGSIFRELITEFGSFVQREHFLAFIRELEELGFLEGSEVGRFKLSAAQDRPWDFNIARVQGALTYTQIPLYTLLELTHACNLGCRTCYAKALLGEEPLEDALFLEGVLAPVIQSGTSYVAILGGEPLLKTDLLLEVVRRLRASHIFTKLITNGTLMRPRIAAELAEAGLNKVEVSLDGCERATNDRFRGRGTFARVTRSLEILGKSKIPQIGLSITVHSDNFNEVLHGLPGFILAHKAHKVYISRFYSRGGQSEVREMTADQERRLAEQCWQWQQQLRSHVPHFEAVMLGRECTCGRSSIVVGPSGTLRACPFITLKEDNLRSGRSLAQIWEHSTAFWQIRQLPRHSCATRNLRDRGTIK